MTGLPQEIINQYKWKGHSIKTHQREIRERLGFQPATLADQGKMRLWLRQEVMPQEHRPIYLEQLAYQRWRQSHVEPPSRKQVERLIASAIHGYEQAFFNQTAARLSESVRANLRELIYQKTELMTDINLGEGDEDDPQHYPLHDLKSGAGQAKVENIKQVAARLKRLQEVGLPADLFTGIPLRFLRQYQQQTAVEAISHLQRREKEQEEKPKTYTLLAAFCWVRQREITDQLVELFIRVLKDIRLRAEKREEKRLLTDFIRVGGKQQLLFRLVNAMWDNPDGVIREVLYPVVGKERLRAPSGRFVTFWASPSQRCMLTWGNEKNHPNRNSHLPPITSGGFQAMLPTEEQTMLAQTIDIYVKEIANRGGDDADILRGMHAHMTTFKRLLDISSSPQMDNLCQQYPGFYRFAKLLENLAAAIADGRLDVPK